MKPSRPFHLYYKRHFPNLKRTSGENSVKCPFHGDRHASMGLNLSNGLFNCHSCDKQGDVYKFEMFTNGTRFPVAERAVDAILGRRP